MRVLYYIILYYIILYYITLYYIILASESCLNVWDVSGLKDKDLRDVGDWRKNIEDKSGMDGRKKMFEAEA